MNCDATEVWFEAELGRYLLAREQHFFENAVCDVFGYHAVQIGLSRHDFLAASRIPLKVIAGRDLLFDCCNLPLESNSIDLLVLPHVLEFSENPHQILREVERVLMPEGRVLLSGFNPFSLWGARKLFNRHEAGFPWSGNFISLPRMKDWFALLGLEVASGKLCCYAPPFEQEKWLRRFEFMEAAGDRWWPISGGVYFLQAIKRVRGVRLLKPAWNGVRSKALAPAADRLKRKPGISRKEE